MSDPVSLPLAEYNLHRAIYKAARAWQRAADQAAEDAALSALDIAVTALRQYVDGPDDCTPRGGAVEESPSYRRSIVDVGRGRLLR